jgi:hypothetical protein
VKVLVTGSRDYKNQLGMRRVFDKLAEKTLRIIIVHGDCPTGADAMATELAKEYGFEVRAYPADWDAAKAAGNPKSAGPIRNAKMIRDEHPHKDGTSFDLGIAFTPDLERSRGTKDCHTRARAAGIKMLLFP